MKFYVGTIVMISHRYTMHHRHIGTIIDADYNNLRFQVKFVYVRKTEGVIEFRKETIEWFDYKDLRDPGISWRSLKMDEMTKAMYTGTVIQMRKELHKIKGKRIIRFSRGLDNYLQTFERGFFRIKNTEFICDFDNYKDLDYKVEAIQ